MQLHFFFNDKHYSNLNFGITCLHETFSISYTQILQMISDLI